ncbi:MAG: DUF1800 domain-containing protein [Acidobacteriales bacterium]|nr:DUF1800 domain-containing protein [Terriglobales bacterium]
MMRDRAGRPLTVLLLASFLSSSIFTPWAAAVEKPAPVATPEETRRAAHALSRLTFGPRPGEIAAVASMGVERWIEQQLASQSINDSALQARLAPLRILKMDPRELVETFPPPQVLKAVAEGKMPMPRDPVKRAIYESALANYKARQAADAKNGGDAQAGPPEMMEADQDMAPETADRRAQRRAARGKAEELIALAPQQRFDSLLKMPPEDRRMTLRSLTPEQRERMVDGLKDEQRETLLALVRPQSVVAGELMHAKLVRAIYSERQLEEVMTDFWFNHLNVFFNKGADRYLTPAYERDAIRPYVLGRFKDMLYATATHPAMLFYLDNWQSVGPNSMAGKFSGRGRGRKARQRMQPMQDGEPPPPQAPRGLNENYARELMELHTLGVDGGYTQQDVQEVAKVFSGWTIKQPRLGGDFEFDARRHEPGSKTVLGHKISDGGMGEGKKVLELLARHPSTARFISRKLAMRFVTDEPPQALVDRMSAVYLKTEGDIKEVLRTLFRSPEFWAPEAYRAKVKTPLEFVVSSIRATGADVRQALPLIQTLQRMGMPLYQMQPPTGYSMKADTWVNSAALLNRMNFALALGNNRMRGVSLDHSLIVRGTAMPTDPEDALTLVASALVPGEISPATRATIRKQMDDPQYNGGQSVELNLGLITGLLLGSPEFQRR